MRVAGVLTIALALDLRPLQPTPARRAGEYLAELARKPAKLAGPIGLAEVSPAHLTELSAQLNMRAQACGQAPHPASELQVHEAHKDALAANTSHLVVRRAGSLLHLRARSVGDSVHVEEVEPPVCSEEPEEDGGQVLSKGTRIVEDTLAWVQGEVDARRLAECASDPRVELLVQHATLKVAAGFVVGLVVRAAATGQGLDSKFPESVQAEAQESVPTQHSGDPTFHKVLVTWEYAALRSVQAAMTSGDAHYNDTTGLIPFGHLPVEPCALLASSSFTVGTLPVEAFYQKYAGYKGFEKGQEHVDLIPPTEPRAMSLRQGRRLLRSRKKRELHLLRKEGSCPKVCPEGYSRHFADLFFQHGDSTCYDDCECSSDANYATVCNLCCRVQDDDSCDAVDPEENCDELPAVPAAFDLREEHAECFPPTVVEDQGLCGSCFAFATIGATADRVCIQQGHRLLDEQGQRHLLSVQQFLSCNEAVDDEDFPSLMPKKWGCDGGYFLAAARYLLRDGLALQDHYPYTSKCVMEGSGVVNDEMHLEETHLGRRDNTCDLLEKWLPRDLLPCSCQGYSSRMRTCAETDARRVKVGGMYRLPNTQDINRHSGTFYKQQDVERMMMLDLMTEGTLYAAFKVYEDFDGWFYDNPDGVYSHHYGQLVGGHAIVIVGWGEKDGVPYWLIRNSWGVNWGDGGHFRVRRGNNECGIEARVWGSSTFNEDAERPQPVNPWTLFGYHEGRTFDGADLRSEDPRDLAHLKEACKFDAACVGFDSAGQLKKRLPDSESEWKSLDAPPIPHGDRQGTSVGGFYTKLTREKVIVQTETAHGVESGTLGPLEVYLCDANEICAPVPVELAALTPGKQTFEKDVWLPVGFGLHSVEVFNRNRRDSWVPSGAMIVALPTRPGSPRIQTERFQLAGSFSPEKAPWEGAAAAFSVLALLLLQ